MIVLMAGSWVRSRPSKRIPAGNHAIPCLAAAALQAGELEGIVDRVRLADRLVLAHAQHPREAHRDARLVALGSLDAFEAQLEDELGLHHAHRAEALDGVAADEVVHLADLLVGEP